MRSCQSRRVLLACVCQPQCAIPSFGYATKWMFVEAMPAAVLGLLLLYHVLQVLRKKFILRRKKKIMTHVPALVGTALVMMYYLYLNLTRSVLDVVNCQPTVPPDGKLYLRTFAQPVRCLLASVLLRCAVVVEHGTSTLARLSTLTHASLWDDSLECAHDANSHCTQTQ